MCWEDTQCQETCSRTGQVERALCWGQGSHLLGMGLEVKPQQHVGGTKSCQSAAFALARRTDPQQDDGRLCAAQGEATEMGLLPRGSHPHLGQPSTCGGREPCRKVGCSALHR